MRSIASIRDDIIEELNRDVVGEVLFDKMSRVLYSTDASIYRIEPIGVVIPKCDEDVFAVVETAHRYGVPLLPRGGGTSLAGQSIGRGIVVDFSKHMRNILEVNVEEGWVRVQPGVILDELNLFLAPYGMHFAPDPSTSNRSNVGGALGNNSCGAHSIVWGKTSDNVIDVQTILSDGSKVLFGALDEDQLESKMRGNSLESDIYRSLYSIVQTHSKEISSRYPRIMRRVSGYNLDELVTGGGFNMARFLVGSEGTLLTIVESKLRIHPIPKHKVLGVLHFRELISAIEATVAVLEMNPSAVELVDSMIIRQARSNLGYSRKMDFVEGDPGALLLVEMIGASESELEDRLDRLEALVRHNKMAYAVRRVTSLEEQARVWEVRKAGLGLMMNIPGGVKPLPFVEDTAVAPEVLPEYVGRFSEIVEAHGTTAGYYGHASVGCLHIRPLLDLSLQDGVDRMVSIATEVSDLVLEFGGAMSGEHGDGLARSVWNEKMFGSQLYSIFRDIKRTFDPKGIMNPGKIVDSPPITENLRVGPGSRAIQITTEFNYHREGNFATALEMCNGQGACRKVTSGTMCPSYMVTRDEKHSTRGRANALRAVISGVLPVETITSQKLYDVLDLCLECKACKVECPSNVDMAKFKYEFLYKYHKANGYSISDRALANISTINQLGGFFAPFSNWVLNSGVFRALLEDVLGIDCRRALPPFARQTFTQWFRARGGSPETDSMAGKVLLFPDTFTNYNYPELGRAATLVLESLGYQVIVPGTRCCGRPMLSAGMLDKARSNAKFNVSTLLPYVQDGAKVIGLEPSCILSFKDDYVDLLNDLNVRTVADNVMLFEEFVLYAREKNGAELKFANKPGKLLFHGHCHQKALVGTKFAMDVLGAIPGSEPREISAGCCGMAGSFGSKKEHFRVSMDIGEQSLFPAIRSEPDDVVIVSEGMSCRQQIHDGTGRKVKHLVEVLSDSL